MKTSSPDQQPLEAIKPPIVVIVGPTAVGKTELSLQLAEILNGEIISADSRLFYKGMDIGTAKPSAQEQLRVPHHLIDIVEPDQTWSLTLFQQSTTRIIADIHSRQKLPIVVGGTGQYVQAITRGWLPPPASPNPKLRLVLEKLSEDKSVYWLHKKLQILDPVAAGTIDPRNVRRTIRALEVIFSTGRTFSSQRLQVESPFQLITIGLKRPRPELYARVDERIEKMFAVGFLEEVRMLLSKGYSPELPSMSAIGYRECVAMLKNEMSLDEAITQMKRLTRIFVRRQSNWFKEEDPSIQWFDVEGTSNADIIRFVTSKFRGE